jgi:hypothetical protein
MWRHGDVLIAGVDEIPSGAEKRPQSILVRGEVTGHAHRIVDPETAIIWRVDNQLFLEVVADSATVTHEEHKPITLPRGTYRFWVQREYSPEAIRRVID